MLKRTMFTEAKPHRSIFFRDSNLSSPFMFIWQGAPSTLSIKTFLIFIVILLAPVWLNAESLPAQKAQLENKNGPSDVRVIIDISGSMKETDPNNLRHSALNMLAEMLPEKSQAGVWIFGKFVNMLVPLGEVDQAWRDKAKGSISKINSVGLMTNLTDALDKATWQLEEGSGYNQSIILLTDGQVDMASPNDKNRDAINQKERQRLLKQVLNKYRKAGAKIHTLGLSDGVDKDLLQQISLETDGLFSEAKNADELLMAFLKVFDQAVPAEQVPMEDNTFVIDGSVNEFTALIFRKSNKQTKLLAPNGDMYDDVSAAKFENVRWYKDLAFDLITVSAPEAGTWIAEADLDANNRVTILSDMSLNVSGFPTTIFAGDKIDLAIALQNAGDVITKPELLRLTDVSVKVIAADGREGTKILSSPETVPEDGVYHEIFTRLQEEGQYQIEVTAESKTFSRKQTIFSNLIQPVEVETKGESTSFEIMVKPLSDNLDLEKSRVIAKVKAPGENAIIQSIAFSEERNVWSLKITEDRGIGDYSVELNIRGVTQSGRTFKVKPKEIQFRLPYEVPTENVADQPGPLMDDMSADMPMTDSMAKETAAEATMPEMEMPADDMKPEESIAPDLAAKMAEQQVMEEAPKEGTSEEKAEPESSEELSKEVNDESVEEISAEEAAEEESGIAWWVYVILAVVNLAVVAGGVWFFMFRKKSNEEEFDSDELPPMLEDEDDNQLPPLGDDMSDESMEEPGDFSSDDSADEESISRDESEEDGMIATNESEPENNGLDDDFAIDSDTSMDDGEDDWGEFDTDIEDAIDEKLNESGGDEESSEDEEKND